MQMFSFVSIFRHTPSYSIIIKIINKLFIFWRNSFWMYFNLSFFWSPQFTLHEKPYFLFPNVLKRWSFQKYCGGIWSFLYYRERWYFFFPKIWSYTLDGKWKMIFLKKYKEIWYFLQSFWKYGLSKGCRDGTWSFLYYLERWYFFPENMTFLPWAIHGNMMHRPAKKNPGNLILRVEVWPLLKFIKLEIFHNE